MSPFSLPPSLQLDFNNLFVGDRIGAGYSRTVYEHALDPNLVIKIETADTRDFANPSEWNLWRQSADYPEVRRWLAPCLHISPNGTVLIQARTTPVKRMPKELPDFFTDVKLANLGLYKGRIVVHDYALTRMHHRPFARVKLKPVGCL